MLRFPNPGSDITSFIRIYVELYDSLSTRENFGLDDITKVLIQRNLATSSGFTGDEALERSTRVDRSRDPLYNQSKMYSELYRILGWLHPLSNSALNFKFTFLGAHVAGAAQNAHEIFKQSILGIVYPNSVLSVSGSHVLRPFVTILRTMAILDGKLNRDEMIVGPLCLENDRDAASFIKMTDRLRNIRGNSTKLSKALAELEEQRGITITTMGNYTRFPLAVMKWTGWVINDRVSVYGRSSPFLLLSKEGYKTLELVDQLKDVRFDDLSNNNEIDDSIMRIGFYQMLERAGFDISPVKDQLKSDNLNVSKHFGYKDPQLLFSPFQELLPATTNRAFTDIYRQVDDTVRSPAMAIAEKAKREREKISSIIQLSKSSVITSLDDDLVHLFTNSYEQTGDLEKTVVSIFESLRSSNKEEFYPLVARLFRSIGYDCEHSRAGVNYQRWDALIKHAEEAIPIEIKSPGEEEFISVKAVRQALENKIILLARKAHPTKPTTTTLVVGYNLPNDRAEVSALISDIYKAYGVTVGVIDTRSLLRMVAARIFQNKAVNHQDLAKLYGIIEIPHT